MIRSSREAAERRAEDEKAQAAATSRLWSSTLKDPRIVRVSRTLGGKDRHSKVRTIRGLRDRRIRMSVPTAIQLYALQDKLGLNQPSKVVDWLIAASQHAIDELPPLEMSMIILQAANDHHAATAAAAAPPFPQLHPSVANVVVPQNYMINSGSGSDGLEAALGRSSKEKEAVKEASTSCYPYYYQNYPMPTFAAPSSSMAAAATARMEAESKQQHKYGGQTAAPGTAAQDGALNPLRRSWNLHAAAGIPSLMVLQQKGMKSFRESSYIPPRTSL